MILHGSLILCTLFSFVQPDKIFVSTANQVWILRDFNGDSDFLDFGEMVIYADALPAQPRGMATLDDAVYLADAGNEILKIADLNHDGDALDFGEIVVYSQLPNVPIAALRGLAVLESSTALATTDTGNGVLYLMNDINHDGDALDNSEVFLAATGFHSSIAAAARPDGALLIAQNSAAMPARILLDRNHDGDFLDFAENLSYCESPGPVSDVFVMDIRNAFLPIAATGQVVRLHDWTADDDALDSAEVLPYASGLSSPHWISGMSNGPLFVTCDDSAGSIIRLQDINEDGDALDFGEAIFVAEGLSGMTGIIAVSALVPTCIRGDFNADSSINLNDVPGCVSAVLSGIGEACRADVNADGQINGRDIRAFVDLVIP